MKEESLRFVSFRPCSVEGGRQSTTLSANLLLLMHCHATPGEGGIESGTKNSAKTQIVGFTDSKGFATIFRSPKAFGTCGIQSHRNIGDRINKMDTERGVESTKAKAGGAERRAKTTWNAFAILLGRTPSLPVELGCWPQSQTISYG